MFKNRNLHRLIRDLMIVSAAVPIIVLGIYAYTSQTSVYNREVETSAKDSVQMVQAVIDEIDLANRSILKTLATHPAIVDFQDGKGDTTRICEVLQNYENQFPQTKEIQLIMPDGTIYSSNGSAKSTDLSMIKSPAYQRAVNNPGRIMLSTVNENRKSIITYGMALSDAQDNRILGVLRTNIDPVKLEMTLSKIKLRVNGTLLVSDRDGNLLFGQYTPVRYLLEKSPGIIKNIMKVSDFGEEMELQEEAYKESVGRSIQTEWRIMAIIPISELSMLHRNTFNMVMVVTILMLIAVTVLSAMVEKIITKPIEHVIQRISEFELTKSMESITMIDHVPTEFKVIQDTLNSMIGRIKGQSDELIRALSNAIEANDKYTKGHCERVTQLALKLGQRVSLNQEELGELSIAAMLHDVGKVGIPSQILNKPEKLTDEEYAIMQTHAEIGANIISDISFLTNVSEIIKQHHERYDGNGYPHGLKQERIDLMARIISISDSYDAMTTTRSYRRKPLDLSHVKSEILNGKGSQFDPQLVDEFVKMIEEDKD